MHGTSMAYTFDEPYAATRKQTQYFELLGDRAIWHQGWKAVALHTAGKPEKDDPWELYHLDRDFSECEDLSRKHPEKLEELVRRWWVEAEKYNVLPLDDRGWQRAEERMRMEFTSRYELYPGASRMDRLICPDVTDRSYRILASLDHDAGDQGVLLAWGSRFGGLVLYIKEGRLVYEYVYSESVRHVMRSKDPLPSGPIEAGVHFVRTGKRCGIVSMIVSGDVVASLELPATWPTYGTTAGLYCGADHGSPVSREYTAPFRFLGKLHKVIIELHTAGEADFAGRYRAALQEQ
jgi:arylsulfatase